MMPHGISQQVQLQYNRHPYPGYPLWIPLRWQDGYLGASAFSRRLCGDLLAAFSVDHHVVRQPILVAGCGDTQLAMLRRMESTDQAMIGVDISRKNLRRTRLRMWNPFPRCVLKEAELHAYLVGCEDGVFSHIDAYGILHHLSDPGATLSEMARCLQPGGTMRLMVYNTPARRWIHGLQNLFRSLGLSFQHESDIAWAQNFLQIWSERAPALQRKCRVMGPSLLAHRSRFVDTFLHAREVRLSPAWWRDVVSQVGLSVVGLFDRYGEWDTYPNPLWQCPASELLEQQAVRGHFSHNLELFICKAPMSTMPSTHRLRVQFSSLYVRTPPTIWFSFPDTHPISPLQRLSLWWGYLQYVYGGKKPARDPMLPLVAAQRLARIGALLPGMVSSEMRENLAAPMETWKEADCVSRAGGSVLETVKISLDETHFLLDKVEACLRLQKNMTPRYRRLIRARIEAVQFLVQRDASYL